MKKALLHTFLIFILILTYILACMNTAHGLIITHYNPCNSINSFYYDGNYDLNPSIVTDGTSAEGTSHINFNNLVGAGTTSETITLSYNDYNTTGEIFLGFWWRFQAHADSLTGMLITFQNQTGIDSPVDQTVQIGFLADHYAFIWDGNQRGGELVFDRWYWIETGLNRTGDTWYFGINGSYWTDPFSSRNLDASLHVNITVLAGKNIGECEFDYMRVSDSLEFPPSSPPPLQLDLEIYLDNSILSYDFYPIYLDRGYFGTNQTLYWDYGQYSLGFESNIFSFVNWSITISSQTSFFGSDSIGGYNTTTLTDKKLGAYGGSYTVNYPVNVSYICIYTFTTAGTSNSTAGIYRITGHDIENAVLMGSTLEVTGINTTMMWRNFTFSDGLSLSSGSYAIAIHGGGASAVRTTYASSGEDNYQDNVADTYSNGLSNPFGAGGSNISGTIISAYAVYTYEGLSVDNSESEQTTLNLYSSGTLTLYMESVEFWFPFRLTMGLVGLLLMVVTPVFTVQQVYKKKNYYFFFTAIVLFTLAYALIVAWLIP